MIMSGPSPDRNTGLVEPLLELHNLFHDFNSFGCESDGHRRSERRSGVSSRRRRRTGSGCKMIQSARTRQCTMALGSVCRSCRRTCATYAEACAPMVRSGASPSGPSSTASAMVNPLSVSTGARCRADTNSVSAGAMRGSAQEDITACVTSTERPPGLPHAKI